MLSEIADTLSRPASPQLWIAVAIPTFAVILSMLTNGWQISQIGKRIDDLREDFNSRHR